MLKKMGNSSKIILVTLILFPILIILFLMLARGCSSSTNSYSEYENKMKSAAQKYFVNKNLLPSDEGGKVEVSLSTLVDEGYIKSPDKFLSDKMCTGNVVVRNNGASVKENNGGYYLYIPDIQCENYKTVHIIDKLLEDVVTEKSGLYQVSDGYVYKGAKVKNYLKFYDGLYFIISIDSDGILKLVRVDSQKEKAIWDAKYNTEKGDSVGKNDYADSKIIDILNGLYLNTNENRKKHMIAYDVCIGRRSLNNREINKNEECAVKLDNQFISLLNTYDFAMASYDVDCISIYSGACSNYNYLRNKIYFTWFMNGVLDNSYQAYYYQGSIQKTTVNNEKKYNIVLYIDGNEVYTKGDGSYSNPYVINN